MPTGSNDLSVPPVMGAPIDLGRRAARKPAARSLNWHLSRLVAGAVLPIVLLLAGIVNADYRADRTRAEHQVQEVARAIALAVERELRATVASLEALALSPSLAADDLDAFRAEAAALANRHFPGASVALLLPNGQQLLNTFRPPGSPLPTRPNLESLTRVMLTGRPAVSDVFMAALQAFPIVPIDVPVHGPAGDIRAILSLAPPLSVFAEVIRQQRPDPAWFIAVLDRKGTIVARTPEPERFVGHAASDSLRQMLTTHTEGFTETVTVDGQHLLTGWSQPGPSGWGVAIGLPAADLYLPHWRTMATTLSLSLLALVGALLMAKAVAHRIALPVQHLVELAKQEPGPGALPPPSGLREVDEVASALTAAMRERAAAEERLRALQARTQAELEDLVEHRTRALQAAQAQLLQAQRMEAVGQLTAGVAHDFNNMLQTQMSGLELLLDAVRGQPVATRYAEQALAAGDHGARLTHSLLAFARKQMLRPEAVAVAPLLERLGTLLTRTLGPRIALAMTVEPGLACPLADPAQLEAALLNIALNARDAMRADGGRLLVEAAQGILPGSDGDACVVLSVSDSGCGMDAETLARACEPFFTTKGTGKGSGLGLSMVQGFAQQSGGALRVQSTQGAGTRVELWLPASGRAAVAEPRRPVARATLREPAGSLLLVEDDAGVRAMLGEMLEEAGFRVRQAANGREALAALRSGAMFDALVTDYAMPGMSGGELVHEASHHRPTLPALIITGYADMGELGHVPANTEVIHKPVRAGELVSRITAMIAGKSSVGGKGSVLGAVASL